MSKRSTQRRRPIGDAPFRDKYDEGSNLDLSADVAHSRSSYPPGCYPIQDVFNGEPGRVLREQIERHRRRAHAWRLAITVYLMFIGIIMAAVATKGC